MSTKQKKKRRENQHSNVQKRLNERFKFDKKRTRKKATSSIPSTSYRLRPSTEAILSTPTISKSEQAIVERKVKSAKTLKRSKTITGSSPVSSLKRKHKFSASPQPKKIASVDSFSPFTKSEDELLTRSRIFTTKRHQRKKKKRAQTPTMDANDREHESDSVASKKRYFKKGTNSYTSPQSSGSPIYKAKDKEDIALDHDSMDDFIQNTVNGSYQKPKRRHTTTISTNRSSSGVLLYNSMGDIYEESETDIIPPEPLAINKHQSSASDALTKLALARPKSNPSFSGSTVVRKRLSMEFDEVKHIKLKRHSSSVLDVTKRVFSTFMNRTQMPIIDDIPDDDDDNNALYIIDDNNSDLSTDSDLQETDLLQCQVISARKFSDHVEYEIEVTYNDQQWVLYKRFKDFYDFNTLLKREYKHLSNYKQLPTLPTRTRILNTMSSKIILERKECFNIYLQNILKIKELVLCPLILHFLKVRGGTDKYSINIWKMGDSQLSFDCHHVLQLRFSARNIPIEEDAFHGCLLRISQKEIHSDYYSSMRAIMMTDFVIDNRHPRFCKTLLYNYHPTKDNNIKIELILSDEAHALPVGSASINIMYLLAKHNGYLYVPIITDYAQTATCIKHRRSLPDLTAINKNHLRVDENPVFTRTPCFIIAATAIAIDDNDDHKANHTISASDDNVNKIAKLTGNSLLNEANTNSKTSSSTYSFQVLPKHALPRNLCIIQWSDDIENKLKGILSNNIETSEFRQSVKTNKKTLTKSNYFSTKIDEKSVREHIAIVLLDCWEKCLDAYSKKTASKSSVSLKNTLLLIMCRLANRFEFDLSHIIHWQHEHVNGFKALTTFRWEKIMKRYYKLFIRTLEISLSIIHETAIDTNNDNGNEEQIFCKEMIGLSAIRMSHMHHKLLPLLVHELNHSVRASKAKRYEFLVQNYPDEDTEKGFMKHSWQEEYVAAIANMHNNIQMILDPFYSLKNPSINPSAWRWFAPPDNDKNTKIQIHSAQQKKFIKNNWKFIIKFIIESLSNYCRDVMYWSKVEGFPRLEQLLIQTIIWTPLDDKQCVEILQFISSLMEVSEMRHCIGNFGKALIRNTDTMHPTQVENCFKFLREWITNSGCVEFGLLPHSFCYDDFYQASKLILSQDDWQLICVFLSFILHYSHLFKESFRTKLFTQLLIKTYFRKLCCHWNHLVSKYYFMVLLYCINRSGYFYEERRKKCMADIKTDVDIINTAHRCYVLFDNMTHLITTRKGGIAIGTLSKQNAISLSKQNLFLTDITTGNKIKYTSTAQEDEEKEMNHLHSVICNMKLVQKIENDCRLIELLNLEITRLLKTKRKEIDHKYSAYIDSAFTQFANLCVRYKKIQLTKKNSWVLGEVIIPSLMYHVRDRDKHLNKFQKADQDSHKFVQ